MARACAWRPVIRLAIGGAAAATFLLGAIAAGPAAAQWRISGTVSERLVADSNAQLEDDGAATYTATTAFDLNIETRTARSTLRVRPGISGSISAGPGDTDDLSRILPRFAIAGTHQWARTDLSVNGRVTVIPTTFSDLSDPTFIGFDAEAVPIFDLDVIEEDALQITGIANLTVGHDINSRNRVSFGTNFRARRFDEDGDNLTPSTTFGGLLNFSHQRTESTSLGASVQLRRISFDDAESSTDYVLDIDGTLQHLVNSRLGFGLGLGGNFTRSREDLTDTVENDAGFNLSGNLSYDLTATTGIGLNARQSVEPGSDGALQTRTVGALTLDHALTETSGLGFDLRYSRQQDVGGTGGNVSDLLSTGLTYRLSLTDTVSGQIGYRFRNRLEEDDSGMSHSIFFSISKQLSVLR